MNPARARQLIRKIIATGEVRFTGHAFEEMKKDDLTTVDCTNVLRGGCRGTTRVGGWVLAVSGANQHDVRSRELSLGDSARGGDGLEAQEMTCMVCGAEMKTGRENFRYDACGLPGVTLMDVEVSRCPQCGEYEVAIPQIDDLHKAIAQALIRKTSRLDAAEVRYLRKYLGWSGADFATHMGMTPETISRWERGSEPIGPVADRLLRLMVATRDPVRDYPLDTLTTISKEQPVKAIQLGLKRDKEGWHGSSLTPLTTGSIGRRNRQRALR